MQPVYWIIILFVIGWAVAGLCRLSWHRATHPIDKESTMTRKAKFPVGKVRAKEIIHLDYLRVYHEILKYEEVLDIDLDVIYEAVISNLQKKIARDKITDTPDPVNIEITIKEVMDKLVGTNKPG